MKVGMYYNNNEVRVEEMPIPKLNKNDILLKVMSSGICGTDIMEWYRIKKAPLVQGHEVSGIIEKSRNPKYKEGTRIFATHHVPCESCRECQRGNKTSCNDFQKINNFTPGAFSEYIRITGRSLDTGIIPLPDEFYDKSNKVKKDAMLDFNKNLEESDAILVANLDKNEERNYIGINTIMEIGMAFNKNKRIFILNKIPKICEEELKAIDCIELNGELTKLK